MGKLAKSAQKGARGFLEQNARPLDRARYAYQFQSGPREPVFQELAKFQNADGGFGNALEPDLRLPDSSVIATTVALQVLGELDADAAHPLVKGALRYLIHVYDAGRKAWPIAPPNTRAVPCAPWWDDPAGFDWLSNPRPEVVRYLYDYAELVPADLRDELAVAVVKYLESLSDQIEMHELFCYLRLVETRTLPEELRARLHRKLEPILKRMVTTDPAAWEGYCLQPLQVAPRPDALFAGLFHDALVQNLDLLIERQGDDGAWWPSWSWGDRSPETWAVARVEWAGHLTLANLKTLRAYERWE